MRETKAILVALTKEVRDAMTPDWIEHESYWLAPYAMSSRAGRGTTGPDTLTAVSRHSSSLRPAPSQERQMP